MAFRAFRAFGSIGVSLSPSLERRLGQGLGFRVWVAPSVSEESPPPLAETVHLCGTAGQCLQPPGNSRNKQGSF